MSASYAVSNTDTSTSSFWVWNLHTFTLLDASAAGSTWLPSQLRLRHYRLLQIAITFIYKSTLMNKLSNSKHFITWWLHGSENLLYGGRTLGEPGSHYAKVITDTVE